MYFALDPKTGIDSHPEQDPWKWAQEVSEKMAVSEDSCLVFIAGQPEAMGVPLYRDLPNNQVHNWDMLSIQIVLPSYCGHEFSSKVSSCLVHIFFLAPPSSPVFASLGVR